MVDSGIIGFDGRSSANEQISCPLLHTIHHILFFFYFSTVLAASTAHCWYFSVDLKGTKSDSNCHNAITTWTHGILFIRIFSTTSWVCVWDVSLPGVTGMTELRESLVTKSLMHTSAVEESTKLLGLWWDSHHSFKKHISVLKAQCKEALNLIWVVAHLKWGGDRDTLLMLYPAIVRSKLDYGCIVYGTASNANLRQLDSIHNSGLRLALGAFCTSPVSSLYTETNEAPLEERLKLSMHYYLKTRACINNPARFALHEFDQTTRDLYVPRPKGRGGMTQPPTHPIGLKVEAAMASAEIDAKSVCPLRIPAFPPGTHNFNPKRHNLIEGVNKCMISRPKAQAKFREYQETLGSHDEVFTDGSKITVGELRSAFMYDPKCSTTFPWCTINAPAAFAWCTINAPAVFAWCTNQFVHKVEFSYIEWNGVHTLWKWERVGAAAVINRHFQNGETTCRHLTKRLPDNSTIFAAEATAVTLALNYYQDMGPVHHDVIVHSDSMSCLQAIEGEDTENPLICHIMNLLWLLNDKGTHIRFCWIPSHCGIDGNERVDQLAKETLDHDIDPLVGVHHADLKPQVNSYIQQLVQIKWDVAVHGRDLYFEKIPALNQSWGGCNHPTSQRPYKGHQVPHLVPRTTDYLSPLWSNTDHWPYSAGVCSVTGMSLWILHSWIIEYPLRDNSRDLHSGIPATSGFFYLIWRN